MDSKDVGEKLIVGDGVHIQGEVTVPTALHVYGEIEGDVKASTIHVWRSGRISGKIVAESLDIRGFVQTSGAQVNNVLTIRKDACITGEIEYRAVQIEAGAIIHGRMGAMDSPGVAISSPALEVLESSEKTEQSSSDQQAEEVYTNVKAFLSQSR